MCEMNQEFDFHKNKICHLNIFPENRDDGVRNKKISKLPKWPVRTDTVSTWRKITNVMIVCYKPSSRSEIATCLVAQVCKKIHATRAGFGWPWSNLSFPTTFHL